jgi:uncharacterized membrane protein YccC
MPAHLVPAERIEQAILLIRGQKLMLDSDLAALYAVPTKVLNQAVRRNLDRFPKDFMLQLTVDEAANLRSQTVTSSSWGGRRHRPYAFTEQGVAMLSSVLNSARAVKVNIEVMRAFVRLRRLMATHADLRRKIEELERRYDKQFAVVFEAIREILDPPRERTKGRIGFRPKTDPAPKP